MAPVNTDLLTQEQASNVLGPHAPLLNDCVQRAWARWLRNPDSATASKRTRATTVYDYIAQEVEAEFTRAAGITLAWKHGSLHMTVCDTAIIKFKKFRGRRLRTSGVATNARNMFLRQAGVLDGMVVTHLVVGYLLDDIEQSTERIAVTCPLGKGNLWVLDLGPDFGNGTGDTSSAPTPLVPQEPDDSGTVIRSTKVVAVDDTAVNEE